MSGVWWTIKCLCPRGDVVAAVSLEDDRVIEADELIRRMHESIVLGRFGSICSRCEAPRESWRIEVAWLEPA